MSLLPEFWQGVVWGAGVVSLFSLLVDWMIRDPKDREGP